jgi:aryl-alcohol dehydrogenase-like predicted oxidoreductase
MVESDNVRSLEKLQLDYVDLYLIHTPLAFQPGDEQDPRDANGDVICDKGVTLLDTWRALEGLVGTETRTQLVLTSPVGSVASWCYVNNSESRTPRTRQAN